MKQPLLSFILFSLFIVVSSIGFSQEIAGLRTTKYIINLNKIKHQEQVDAIVIKTKNIPNVSSCKLDWINYKMEITVNEGADLGVFSMEKLKAILIENNVSLVKFTKELISK